jgi:hypothetical protein
MLVPFRSGVSDAGGRRIAILPLSIVIVDFTAALAGVLPERASRSRRTADGTPFRL